VIAEPAVPVRIRFDKRWSTYVQEHIWHPSQQLTPGPGGGIELSMQVGGTAELRSWVLSFGAGAEVLEPASLRSEVVKELAGGVARYRGG
jgi:predicted DNA-binding transcriptional regulator YafY